VKYLPAPGINKRFPQGIWPFFLLLFRHSGHKTKVRLRPEGKSGSVDMAFWEKETIGSGWTSVVLDADRISIACVTRGPDARPQVEECDSFVRDGSDLDALKRLKNARRLARNHCTTVLGQGQYQLLQVDRPDSLPKDAPPDELRETLRWRIKEMVDFPIDQAGIDILPIPPQAGRTPQLWVAAASHDILRPRVHLFQDAKVPLEAIDIPELAQRNLAGLFEELNRGLALVSFDDKGGQLTITYQGELFMTRHMDVSGPELVRPDAGGLHERVLLDIQRSLDNFDRNYSSIPLTRLLVGPLPGGEVFVDYLRSNLSLPVASANLAEVMDFSAVPRLQETAAQADAWVALGAALRE
jgi:MSHA biogenesis protein MshI